ncbi:MAG: tRNA1(Val) (adenine(37)-N6)-methyltransferase [Atribacterota bacterium]
MGTMTMQEVNLSPGEIIEILGNNKLRIIQDKNNYCFSQDSILLSGFVKVRYGERVIDLGTGCAIIPLMIYNPTKKNTIFAVEIQEKLANIARRNVSLNNLEESISVISDDMRNLFKQFQSESFDVATANPPYIPLGKGKQNVRKSQLLARHEINIDLESLISICHFLLKKRGRLYLIHRADRLIPVVMLLKKYQFEPKLLQFIHTRKNEKAKRFLIESRKEGGTELEVLSPRLLNH